MALAAAVLTAVGAWQVGERMHDHFGASVKASTARFDFSQLNKEMAIANGKNGAAVFGTLGGLLGLSLGFVGGLSRRSAIAAVSAAVFGLILGAAAGALPAFVVMPWQWNHRHDDPFNASMIQPMLIHAALWSALGAAAGLAYAIGRARPSLPSLAEGLLGGLLGAVVGTAVYDLVGAVEFPFAKTSEPFAETSGTRLLAHLCVAAFVAAGVLAVYRLRPLPSDTTGAAPSKPA
jgi:hypothetical protein